MLLFEKDVLYIKERAAETFLDDFIIASSTAAAVEKIATVDEKTNIYNIYKMLAQEVYKIRNDAYKESMNKFLEAPAEIQDDILSAYNRNYHKERIIEELAAYMIKNHKEEAQQIIDTYNNEA